MQKSAAVVQRFCELRGDNEAFALFPHQLMDVRRATLDPKRVPCTVQSMVPLFVDRIFEVHVRGHCPVTGEPAMSLAEFADFLLAWNYRGHLASIKCAPLTQRCAPAPRPACNAGLPSPKGAS